MEGNPYLRMLAAFRHTDPGIQESEAAGFGARPARMRLGEVTQRKPLKVCVAGIEQPTEVLWINERLTEGATWREDISSPTVAIPEADILQLEIDLDVGDQVLMLTEDDQIFFILARVVKAV